MATTPNRPTIAQRANRFAVGAALVFGMLVGYNYNPDDTPTALTQQVPTVEVAEPREDDPGFDCRVHGNEVCGPTAEYTPGCYRDGVLVMPWSDELRGLAESPCGDVVGTYDVPGGALTVLDDGSARFVPVAGGVELGS